MMKVNCEPQVTILLVIEDDSARLLIKRILKEDGFQVVSADDSASGMELCRKHTPDLVCFESCISGTDGVEFYRILSEDDQFADIPMIMLTEPELTEWRIKAFDSGEEGSLSTHVGNSGFAARIRTHLERSRSSRFRQQIKRKFFANQQQLIKEVHAAAEFQKKLLPKEIQDCKALHFSAFFRPCQEVGGDIYNIHRLDEEHLAFYILDVSGHGYSVAMMTALATQALSGRGCYARPHTGYGARGIVQPREIIRRLDREFPLARFDLYMTIAYLLYNTTNHSFQYCCAGHPPIVHMKKSGSVSLLDTGGPPVGMGGTWSEGKGRLDCGDRLYFYTDGLLIECNNEKRELYGTQRLIDSMTTVCEVPLEEAVQKIIRKLECFGGEGSADDDMALMAVERNEKMG